MKDQLQIPRLWFWLPPLCAVPTAMKRLSLRRCIIFAGRFLSRSISVPSLFFLTCLRVVFRRQLWSPALLPS